MSTINQQTQGPLLTRTEEQYERNWLKTADGKSIAATAMGPGDDPKPWALNARLLAAAYNAFDKAGRELGVDAAELAEKVDLVRVLRDWCTNEQWSTNETDNANVQAHFARLT